MTLLANASCEFLAGCMELIYPSLCNACGLRLGEERSPLCPGCARRLERAEPASLREEVSRLPGAVGQLDDVFALWVFDKGGTVQRLQHRLKYGNRPRLGLELGRLVAEGWLGLGSSVDLLVPVPLSRLRELQRGYNQSAWLAEGMAGVLERPCLPAGLRRTRETRSQTSLSVGERIENTRGAFSAARSEALAGRKVLLVDDVLTTGATGLAAARALRDAGAAQVHVAALAFARPG